MLPSLGFAWVLILASAFVLPFQLLFSNTRCLVAGHFTGIQSTLVRLTVSEVSENVQGESRHLSECD